MSNYSVDMNLLPEERCGHLVTSQTKKLWAVQLGCLEELKRVCKKYDISYFASGGTLLGAVRHKGFIPWDDDLDVMMLKEDYERFCAVAPNEIREPFFFQHFNTENGAGPGMSRIRNSDTTGCTQYEIEMASDGYNLGIFIDIFPLFGVEDNLFRLFVQKCQISVWRFAIAGYERSRKNEKAGSRLKNLVDPSVYWWKLASIFLNHVSVSNKFMKACGKAKLYSQVGLLSFSGFNKKLIWDKEWFEEFVSMPFENTELICPKEYDPILRTQYGDYMKFVKGGSIHTMAIIDPDTPYSVRLKDNRKTGGTN